MAQTDHFRPPLRAGLAARSSLPASAPHITATIFPREDTLGPWHPWRPRRAVARHLHTRNPDDSVGQGEAPRKLGRQTSSYHGVRGGPPIHGVPLEFVIDLHVQCRMALNSLPDVRRESSSRLTRGAAAQRVRSRCVAVHALDLGQDCQTSRLPCRSREAATSAPEANE